VQGAWWTAFGTGGFEGEPPLLEGVCYGHLGMNATLISKQNWASTSSISEPSH